MSPYREPHVPEQLRAPTACPDRDVILVFLLAWLLAVARVIHGLATRETFGADATLAFLAVFVVPYLMRNAILWCSRRAWRRMGR